MYKAQNVKILYIGRKIFSLTHKAQNIIMVESKEREVWSMERKTTEATRRAIYKYDDKFISNVCSLQDQDRDKGNSFGGNYSYKFDGYSINSGMGNNKGRGRVRRR